MADIFTNGEFDKLSLTDRLERLRKEYCTGPCGQSNSVHCRREATNRTLKEARETIVRLENESFNLMQTMKPYCEQYEDIPGNWRYR